MPALPTSDEPSEASPLLRNYDGHDATEDDIEMVEYQAMMVYLAAADQLLTVATHGRSGSELNALNITSWIATAYFLTLTSCQPLYGKLSDIFALGCLGRGLAQSMAQLCAARAVAGMGGGAMNSVVAILLSDLVPLKDRGVWQGKVSILYATGTATGAPLAGVLADSVGWRW
ncbi:hypothetical protein ACHAPU_005280 [Fusarium lateritium]